MFRPAGPGVELAILHGWSTSFRYQDKRRHRAMFYSSNSKKRGGLLGNKLFAQKLHTGQSAEI